MYSVLSTIRMLSFSYVIIDFCPVSLGRDNKKQHPFTEIVQRHIHSINISWAPTVFPVPCDSGESRTKKMWSVTSTQRHVFGKDWLEKAIDKGQRKNVRALVDIGNILIQLSFNRWGNQGLENYLLRGYMLISGKSDSRLPISCFSHFDASALFPAVPSFLWQGWVLHPYNLSYDGIFVTPQELYLHQGEQTWQWFPWLQPVIRYAWWTTLRELLYRTELCNHTVQFRLEGPTDQISTHSQGKRGRKEPPSSVVLDSYDFQAPLPSFTPLPQHLSVCGPLSSEASSWYLCETQKFWHLESVHLVGRLLKCGSLTSVTSWWTGEWRDQHLLIFLVGPSE